MRQISERTGIKCEQRRMSQRTAENKCGRENNEGRTRVRETMSEGDNG